MTVRILRWLMALLFVAAGVPKLVGVAQVAANFEHFGYSPGFRVLVGVLEIVGGVALLVPDTVLYGAVLLLVIMAGAVWTLFRVSESVMPPVIVGALLAVIALARVRQPRISALAGRARPLR